jgi:hypothetical protein
VFVCQERSVDATRGFLSAARVNGRFTYQPIHLRNHNDAWTLRDIPERRLARQWLANAIA